MKLAICLPALNESATLGNVLQSIPPGIPGFSEQRVIVVDDGSTDNTAEIARQHGAQVIKHVVNRGTGRAFISGVVAALKANADVIVCMDSDGQFDPRNIVELTQPIIDGRATVCLCTRFGSVKLIGRMPWRKRAGNWLLSSLFNVIIGGRFTDVSCGFRAFTREAALRLDIHSEFEYIHESLLIWSRCGQVIQEVSLPVLAERTTGKSRVVNSILRYAARSAPVLIRAIRDYSPFKFFGFLAAAVLLPAVVFGSIVSIHWFATGETAPYTQMITLSVGGTLLSFLLVVLALIADLIARLKFQVEELLYESRRNRFSESTDFTL